MTKLRKPKEFTINRSEWMNAYTNEKTGTDSKLLDKDSGRMCCLGFYAKACGVPESKIINQQSPRDIKQSALPWLMRGGLETQLCDGLMETNDGLEDHKKREKEIKEQFELIGVKVKFAGRYPSVKQLDKERIKLEEKW